MNYVRIATRKSPLAVWQAEAVAELLTQRHPGIQVQLVKLSTQGDRVLDSPLNKIGGKGLFVKELEQALLDQRADIAVHSIKDVPMSLPPGLQLPVILTREDPADALVSNDYGSLTEMPIGARVGTSSLRRIAQLRRHYPQLEFETLRGNVGSRLSKLDAGDYQAIILAAAGLKRLGLTERIAARFSYNDCLPAIGQGAIGIECRYEDSAIEALLAPLHHIPTARCITAERAFSRRLNGGCQAPIAGIAEYRNTSTEPSVQFRGLVADPSGARMVAGATTGPAAQTEQAQALGEQLAEQLLARGAKAILADLGL